MTTDPAAERVTHREVAELLRAFEASGWSGMDLTVRGMHIVIGKHGPPTAMRTAARTPVPSVASEQPSAIAHSSSDATKLSSPPGPVAAPDDTAGLVAVRSPTVGAFWVAPSPGQAPFVAVGQTVAEGDQLAIIEVMKLMNPVLAPVAGEVTAVCTANASGVEFDQVLFWIRPVDGTVPA